MADQITIVQDPSQILDVKPELMVDKSGAGDSIMIFNLVLKFDSEFAEGGFRGSMSVKNCPSELKN